VSAAVFAGAAAVGFDLDGTLLDTLPDIAAAGNVMLASLGQPPVEEEVVRGFIGDGVAILTKRLLTGRHDGEPEAALFERALHRFETHYAANVSVHSRPFPGVADGLATLAKAGLRLACITNKPERFTLPLLEAHGLRGFFEVVLSGDSLPRKKPDPLPLLHCCEAFGVTPGRFVYLGDSSNDVAAARAAGCPVACVPYGYRGKLDVRDLGADAIVRDVPALARLLSGAR
jgi:phosphoglycolate phosphatase